MTNKVAHYPHFLGIGAARAGTTWLSEQLNAHPDVWIPAIKELHYFTRSSRYVGPSHLADGSIVQRLFSRDKPYRQYRKAAQRAIASNIMRPSIRKLMWDANFLLRRPNDRWYATLFSQGFGKVTGEITPRYSMLECDDIRELRRLIPDLKLIFIMRDPVERAWSLVKYHEQRGGQALTELPADELRRRAFSDPIVRQSDYEAILKRWRSVFPPEQLLELYFDEIREQPDALLRRIQRFLGIPIAGLSEDRLRGKVNGSFRKPMPGDLRQALIAYYRPMMLRLSEEEGGYFTRWLERYDSRPAEPARVVSSARIPGFDPQTPPLNL